MKLCLLNEAQCMNVRRSLVHARLVDEVKCMNICERSSFVVALEALYTHGSHCNAMWF